MMQGIERRVLNALSGSGVSSLWGRRVLEVGCGAGHWLRELVQWGANPHDVVGLDLLPSRLRDARRLCADGIRLYCGDGAALALPSGWFDLVLQVTVFTSILDPDVRRRMASEMLRVVKPDGLILWYDFHVRSPKNPRVRAVPKQEIKALFPDCRITLRRMTLAPPLTRFLAPHSWLLCQMLERMSLLCTHYLGVIRKS
jgi:SAM-dependent methyltransferase